MKQGAIILGWFGGEFFFLCAAHQIAQALYIDSRISGSKFAQGRVISQQTFAPAFDLMQLCGMRFG